MTPTMVLYLYLAAGASLVLGLNWSRKDWPNTIFRVMLFLFGLWGFYLALLADGVVVKGLR